MNNSSPDLITDAHIHQQLNESHLSYNELFRRFEKNQDGRVEIDQLHDLLEKHGLETSDQNRSETIRVSFNLIFFFSSMNHFYHLFSALSIKVVVYRMHLQFLLKNLSIMF